MKIKRVLYGLIPLLSLGACGGSELVIGDSSADAGSGDDAASRGGSSPRVSDASTKPHDASTKPNDASTDANADADGGGGGEFPDGGGEPPDPSAATAYLINAAHTGAVADSSLVPPLRRRWNLAFGDATSYPLIVHGVVYVIVGARAPAPGLLAIDAKSGEPLWGPIDIGKSDFNVPSLAYDNGRIFTVNGAGLMQAFDAVTGHPIWASVNPY